MEVSLASFRKRFTYDPVKDLLGKGGFSEVYKAFDTEDKIFVALKILHTTADNKHNLTNEVKRFKRLRHPNIIEHIEAYEVNTGSNDIHGNPILYAVGILEYADSGTLADLLKKGKPDYKLIEDIAQDINAGLAYLHANNIIHRDLKPSNILLFKEGEKLRAKISDFGIAKRADATAASTQLVGTIEYMSPEYFTTGNITAASDLWSLGVMLVEATTGKHPFGKGNQGLSNQQIINNILHADLSSITADVPAALRPFATQCLLREAYLRPQSSELNSIHSATNDFSEKTRVIEKKDGNIPTPKQPAVVKWKGWMAALFDFDLKEGRWRKVLVLIIIIISSYGTVKYYKFKQSVKKKNQFTNAINELALNLSHNIVSEDNFKFIEPNYRTKVNECYISNGFFYEKIEIWKDGKFWGGSNYSVPIYNIKGIEIEWNDEYKVWTVVIWRKDNVYGSISYLKKGTSGEVIQNLINIADVINSNAQY